MISVTEVDNVVIKSLPASTLTSCAVPATSTLYVPSLATLVAKPMGLGATTTGALKTSLILESFTPISLRQFFDVARGVFDKSAFNVNSRLAVDLQSSAKFELTEKPSFSISFVNKDTLLEISTYFP